MSVDMSLHQSLQYAVNYVVLHPVESLLFAFLSVLILRWAWR